MRIPWYFIQNFDYDSLTESLTELYNRKYFDFLIQSFQIESCGLVFSKNTGLFKINI